MAAFSHHDVPHLVAAKRAGRLVPLVGAGLSIGMPGNFPLWRDLPARLLEQCDRFPGVWHSPQDRDTLRALFLASGPMSLASLLSRFDVLKQKLGRHYRGALTAIFRPRDGAPRAAQRAVLALGTQVVLTTNYDRLLEDAEPAPPRLAYTWRSADDALADIKDDWKVLFKVHGSTEDERSIVLTQSEYAAAHADPAYRKVMDHLLLGNSILFLGYGMADPQDLDLFLDEHATTLRSSASSHYALLKRLPDPQAEVDRQAHLGQKRISVIPLDDYPEITPFLEALGRA